MAGVEAVERRLKAIIVPRGMGHVLVDSHPHVGCDSRTRIANDEDQYLAILVSGSDIHPHIWLHRRLKLRLLVRDLPSGQAPACQGELSPVVHSKSA